MKVTRHAAANLVSLTQKLPVPASVIIARLEAMEPPKNSVALEVARLQSSHGVPHVTSNGDSVICIIRDGLVVTTMLRRSYNQSMDPAILRVDEFISWKDEWTYVAA